MDDLVLGLVIALGPVIVLAWGAWLWRGDARVVEAPPVIENDGDMYEWMHAHGFKRCINSECGRWLPVKYFRVGVLRCDVCTRHARTMARWNNDPDHNRPSDMGTTNNSRP